MQMTDFYKQFCREELNDDGTLKAFEAVVPDGFNFAYDVVDRIADADPNRRALVWCNDSGEERQFSFGEMRDYSNRAASYFRKHGVKKGDMVLLVLKRHYQFWFAILALHKLGAVAIPATNLLTVKDYIYRFESAGVNHVVCTAEGEVTKRVEEACRKYEGVLSKFVVRGSREGWLEFDSGIEEQPSALERTANSKEDTLLLYFTSGTTGYPKMVFHDHSYPIAHIITAKYWHNATPDGLHLTVSETGWAKSVWGKLYGQWLMGCAIFVYDFDKFSPEDLLQMIAKYKVSTFCAPPTIYRFFIKEGLEGYDFSSVRHATTAGEALNPEVYHRFLELTGLKLMEAFGQTETTVLTLNQAGTDPKPGSMGRPSPLYEVALLNDLGEPVVPGEIGELVVKVPEGTNQIGLYRGYYKDNGLTRSVWYDNYYHTGDTAWQDEDGCYWYVGRTDDIIKASGYRIGPFEIESVLMEHPAVLECAVTGAPDPMRGTVVKATVVLTTGYEPSNELRTELQEYVKRQTAPYKYPRIVDFVQELPKTISGKIMRAVIRGDNDGAF